jgi:hypothetical protein
MRSSGYIRLAQDAPLPATRDVKLRLVQCLPGRSEIKVVHRSLAPGESPVPLAGLKISSFADSHQFFRSGMIPRRHRIGLQFRSPRGICSGAYGRSWQSACLCLGNLGAIHQLFSNEIIGPKRTKHCLKARSDCEAVCCRIVDTPVIWPRLASPAIPV